jgi:hypothetical protein
VVLLIHGGLLLMTSDGHDLIDPHPPLDQLVQGWTIGTRPSSARGGRYVSWQSCSSPNATTGPGRRSERGIEAASSIKQKSLREFDFNANPGTNPATIHTLTSCE